MTLWVCNVPTGSGIAPQVVCVPLDPLCVSSLWVCTCRPRKYPVGVCLPKYLLRVCAHVGQEPLQVCASLCSLCQCVYLNEHLRVCPLCTCPLAEDLLEGLTRCVCVGGPSGCHLCEAESFPSGGICAHECCYV